MSESAQTATEPSPAKRQDGLHDRLFKTGLIGAGALTITWWALIACGVWRALEWAGV
ncbi:hypothetical protein HCU64_01650 [Methylobacterium sp. C25]|uniref:hypothetical protein n=1 Tax=Methylobacterium sp. C25 TaxID=2721622 RepID=UPI001F36FEB5|nr:hypothetical protein [Methylobacterium sp. C25]MCE4222443.1 hypothetical protein [Methylobacterium sp. C25]